MRSQPQPAQASHTSQQHWSHSSKAEQAWQSIWSHMSQSSISQHLGQPLASPHRAHLSKSASAAQ
tara:strand:+ start:370 stop:564 length:195 start_codon:yes stop_codon:yes gene_type:complete